VRPHCTGYVDEMLRVFGAAIAQPKHAVIARKFAFDAELAERVMGRTIVSSYAGEAGDAILEGWDVTPRLGEIGAPTLILVGRDDFVCPPSRAEIIRERIPNSELVVLEQSGHFAHAEEPAAFFEAVRRWLERA